MLDNHNNILYNTSCCKSAAMAQMVEHVLGKDEVTGSNPVSSSNKSKPFGLLLFLEIF